MQAVAPPPNFIVPFDEDSDYDKSSLQENLSLRYVKIPFTTLYAEAQTEQQDIGQDDQFAAPEDILNNAVFLQHTAFSSQSDDLRFGFSSSPWRSAAFSAQFRRYEDDSQYDSDPLIQPSPTAYPTFIRSRQLITDEVETKLILYFSPRFKTIFSYQYQDDAYDVNTGPYLLFGNTIAPGGELMAGQDYSHIFSVNVDGYPHATALSFHHVFLSDFGCHHDGQWLACRCALSRQHLHPPRRRHVCFKQDR